MKEMKISQINGTTVKT